jgi:hypothetical protein
LSVKYIDDEAIQLMKERGTYLVLTVYIEDWLMGNYTLGFTTSMIEKMNLVVPIARQRLLYAFQSECRLRLARMPGCTRTG